MTSVLPLTDNNTKRNILLRIAYDGTDYSGWQRQDHRAECEGAAGKAGGKTGGKKCATVQGTIEEALEKIHKHPVHLAGSGRTDAGVHARSQAATFYTDINSMGADRFVPALNSLLPHDIRIAEAREVPDRFHARFDAHSRTYRYFFIPAPAHPAETRYALELRRRPGIALLNDYCRLFRGEFDCTVFASQADKSLSRFRYIHGALFFVEGEKIVFEIRANAFLWKMVRSLAGTLLFYEKQETPPACFRDIALSGKRELAGPTLPPRGLFLWDVEFAPDFKPREKSGFLPERP